MRTASFHARRLPRTRANCSYVAVGDKDKTYVVTADANVYYQKSEWFGSGYEYIWQYSAATKTEATWLESNVYPDIEGDPATAIRANVVAAYDILADAKAYADTLYASTQAGGTTPPTTTVPATGGGTVTVPSTISTPASGGGSTPPPPTTPTVPAWVWPAVAVVAIGGVTAVVIGAAGKKDKKKAEEAK